MFGDGLYEYVVELLNAWVGSIVGSCKSWLDIGLRMSKTLLLPIFVSTRSSRVASVSFPGVASSGNQKEYPDRD